MFYVVRPSIAKATSGSGAPLRARLHAHAHARAQVVVWSRRLPQGVAYQAGMSPNGRGEVSSVFDTATGTYVVGSRASRR
jgi:hypothetical protein